MASTACTPFSAMSTRWPAWVRIALTSSWLVRLSSARRIERESPACAAGVAGCTLPGSGASRRRKVNQNVEPWPGVLSNPISPPISATTRRQMASPRPTPPNARLAELSACPNGWNRRARSSGAMPMPVSATSILSAAVPSPTGVLLDVTPISPAGVNLIALPIRLSRTWRKRPGSPSSRSGGVRPGSPTTVSPIPLVRIWPRTVPTTCSISRSGQKGTACSVTRPTSSRT
jgi:hypothetical protein